MTRPARISEECFAADQRCLLPRRSLLPAADAFDVGRIETLVAGHLADHLKLRNVRRDPRVTLSVESDVPFEGFSPYLVIKGIARVEEGGAVDVLRRITKDQFPPPGGDYPAGFVTRISPQKISGTGPWGQAD